MARLQAELDSKQAEYEAIARKMDSVNRILAKHDLEPLKRLTLEEWQAQQEGAGGSGSIAGQIALGLQVAF
jgi:hypothetical protein